MRLLFVLGTALALLALVPAAHAAAPRPKIEFVRTFGGGEGDDTVYAFALAPDGAVYVGGHAHGPSLLGQPTADAADVFVARFGKGGKFQWARMLKGTADDFLFGLAAGPDNSVYATGYTASPVFEGNPNRGDYDAFVAKFDRDGNREWLKILGGTGQDVAHDVVVSPAGDVIVAGTTGSPAFQKLPTDGYDGFVAWYAPDGRRKRLRLAQGPGDDYVTGMTLLGDRSVVVAGTTRDSTSSDPDPDPFLARFSPKGKQMWKTAASLGARQWVNDVTTAAGGIYVTGYEESQEIETSPDVVLVRYGLDGSFQWKKVFVGAKLDRAERIVAAGDELLLAGVGLRTKPLHTALGEPFYGDAMLVRVGLGGKLKRTYYFGGGGKNDEGAFALARRPDGFVYLGGGAAADTFLGKRSEPHGDAFLVGLRLPGGASTRLARGAPGR